MPRAAADRVRTEMLPLKASSSTDCRTVCALVRVVSMDTSFFWSLRYLSVLLLLRTEISRRSAATSAAVLSTRRNASLGLMEAFGWAAVFKRTMRHMPHQKISGTRRMQTATVPPNIHRGCPPPPPAGWDRS